jgi:hypothetical protein
MMSTILDRFPPIITLRCHRIIYPLPLNFMILLMGNLQLFYVFIQYLPFLFKTNRGPALPGMILKKGPHLYSHVCFLNIMMATRTYCIFQSVI